MKASASSFQLASYVGHSLLGVLEAELHLLAAGHAEDRPSGTPWVTALLAHHVNHSLPGVLGAELHLLAAGHAEARPSGTPWVAALARATSLALGGCTR